MAMHGWGLPTPACGLVSLEISGYIVSYKLINLFFYFTYFATHLVTEKEQTENQGEFGNRWRRQLPEMHCGDVTHSSVQSYTRSQNDIWALSHETLASSRVVPGTGIFTGENLVVITDHPILSSTSLSVFLLHDQLHWLDVPERVSYKLGVMVYRCVYGRP